MNRLMAFLRPSINPSLTGLRRLYLHGLEQSGDYAPATTANVPGYSLSWLFLPHVSYRSQPMDGWPASVVNSRASVEQSLRFIVRLAFGLEWSLSNV